MFFVGEQIKLNIINTQVLAVNTNAVKLTLFYFTPIMYRTTSKTTANPYL